MLASLHHVPDASAVLPFRRLWDGSRMKILRTCSELTFFRMGSNGIIYCTISCAMFVIAFVGIFWACASVEGQNSCEVVNSHWLRDLRVNSDGTFIPRNGYQQKTGGIISVKSRAESLVVPLRAGMMI